MNQQLSPEDLAKIAPEAVAEQRRMEHETAAEVLKSAGCHPERSSARETRKQEIIDSLPEGFLEEMRGHIHNHYVRETLYFKHTPEFPTDQSRINYEKRILRGALFEALVQYDKNITSQPTEISMEILAALQNPDVLGLKDEIGFNRNPDETYIEVDESGHLRIKEIGEAKLGKLDERFLSQMESMQRSLEKMLEVINVMSTEDLRAHGLSKIAERSDQKVNLAKLAGLEIPERPKTLELVTGYTRVLALPEDRSQEFELLMKAEDITRYNRKRYNEVMTRVTIKRSAFRANEVGDMADVLYDKLF